MRDSDTPVDQPVRDAEDAVRDAPAPFSVVLVMLLVPAIIAGAWLLLPDTTVGIVVLGIIVVAAVAFGLWRVLSLRALSARPGRHPMPPWSAG